MRYFRVSVRNEGAMHTAGLITDPAEIAAMNEAMEHEEVSGYMEYVDDNGDECEFSEYDHNEITDAYGPFDSGSMRFSLREYTDDTYETEIENENTLVDSDEDPGANWFSYGNPMHSFTDEDIESDKLLWLSQKVEKRIYFECSVVIPDGEDFSWENLHIGSIELDEIGFGQGVVKGMYYIPENELIEIAKSAYGKDYGTYGGIEEVMSEILDEDSEEEEMTKYKPALEKYLLEVSTIEGKGEYETDFHQILNLDLEELYNSDECEDY